MVTLPLVLFVVLVELAAGGFVVLLLADFQGEVGPGFLALTALLSLAASALAYWLASASALDALLPSAQVDPVWLGLLLPALGAFTLLLAVYTVLVFAKLHRVRRIVGVPTLVFGVTALLVTAMTYRGPYFAGIGAPLSFAAGGLTLGAVTSGMMLGHWYLVTPTLSVRPLRRINWLFLGGAIAQGLLVPLSLGLVGADPARLVVNDLAVLFWLRVGIGIAAPVLIGFMTWRCCRLRALPSATGLLYVGVAAVFFGEVVARVIFFTTGVAV